MTEAGIQRLPAEVAAKMGSWRHGYALTNGIQLHYVTQGEGELAILLHGFPEFWYSWRHQIPVLAQRFRVVAPDLRGYNDSDKPDHGYDLDTLTEDVRGLLHHFGAQKAVVVAHDWGEPLPGTGRNFSRTRSASWPFSILPTQPAFGGSS